MTRPPTDRLQRDVCGFAAAMLVACAGLVLAGPGEPAPLAPDRGGLLGVARSCPPRDGRGRRADPAAAGALFVAEGGLHADSRHADIPASRLAARVAGVTSGKLPAQVIC